MDNAYGMKHPAIIRGDNSVSKITRIPLTTKSFQEDWLQRVLEDAPQLLSAYEIDPVYAPLVCIGREVPTNAGYIDNLYISPKGYVTIVETKLWRNPEARREVIGQILDYAKEICRWSYSELDQWAAKYLESKTGKPASLFGHLVSLGLLIESDEARFIDTTENNLHNARFLLMVVGDGIREGVVRMKEFLNENANLQYTLALVEMEVYQLNETDRLVIPNFLIRTTNIERGVIRIEGLAANQVQVEFSNGTASDELPAKPIATATRNPMLSEEDYITDLAKAMPALNTDEVRNLLDDLSELGFTFGYVKQCKMQFHFPLSKKPSSLLYLTLDGRFYRETDGLQRALLELNYSPEISQAFWEEMIRFCDEKDQNTYSVKGQGNYMVGGAIATLLQQKEKFLSIMEQFASNFG